jgi:hypothetical protein
VDSGISCRPQFQDGCVYHDPCLTEQEIGAIADRGYRDFLSHVHGPIMGYDYYPNGTPFHMYGFKLPLADIGCEQGSAEEKVVCFLRRFKDMFVVRDLDRELTLFRVYTADHVTDVLFVQMYDGYEVSSHLRVTFNTSNEVVSIDSWFVPNLHVRNQGTFCVSELFEGYDDDMALQNIADIYGLDRDQVYRIDYEHEGDLVFITDADNNEAWAARAVGVYAYLPDADCLICGCVVFVDVVENLPLAYRQLCYY